MITFKQLEALYWIDRLGGFAAAARHLHTTQSAISKRVQELEAALDIEVFDRRQRVARLSERGEALLHLARRLLEERDAGLERIAQPEVLSRRLRLGVTELTAMTWLPRLVQAIRERYPRLELEPDVDMSVPLRDKLLAGEVDLIVVPDAFEDPRLERTPLAQVESAWMCKPGLAPARRVLGMRELSAYPLMMQGGLSGTGVLYERWLRSLGAPPPRAMSSSSLVALLGLTVAGLGVSYLPRQCLRGMIADHLLTVLRTDPPLPPVTYVAMRRADSRSRLLDEVTEMARALCDFDRPFQGEGAVPAAVRGARRGGGGSAKRARPARR